MTEKWIIENGEIKDTTTNITFDSFVEILTVLNGQSMKITELASDNKRLKFQLNDCLNKKLFSRRELEKENEQLKKENYELHKKLGDFESFEEHIQERTSKTSVNNIIGLIKTDEPTNSVELKKELYK